MSLEQTIKDLEQLEEALKSSTEKITEEQLEKITSQLQGAFDFAQDELNKLEEESKITLENLQNEE
jgi:ABC-type transporter Mla subunit MlaD